MAPHLDPNDTELARDLMDARKGSEKITCARSSCRTCRRMYDDLTRAVENADLLISGEIVFAVKSVVEKTGIKWVSASLQPGTLFSAYDPFVPPAAEWLEHLRFLGPTFHSGLFSFVRWSTRSWYAPYRDFRRELGLSEDHDPIFRRQVLSRSSSRIVLGMLGAPQPDWPPDTVQTGFCFYDGRNDTAKDAGRD